FCILLIGVLVFSFYQFNRPPVFFNNYEVEQVKKSQYAPQFNALEKQYEGAFANKKEKTEALVKAFDSRDASQIASAKIDLKTAEKRTDTIRKSAINIIKKNSGNDAVNDTNYVFLTFVTQYLPKGLIGLLIAIIFLASMGSTASGLNALACTSVVDIYKRILKPDGSEQSYVTASRLATVFWGLVCIGMALYASKIGNLLEAVNQLGSYIYGTILGVFIVAFYLKKIKGTPVFLAAVITEALICVMGYYNTVAYLWLNAIGCIGVIIIAYILNKLIPAKPAIAQ
ncbi:sodium:solute symporter, partial [Mucilaginibacter sp. 5B2]|nr:sodium:solute symporter [Mucilaginibacter sp. 5B2]